MVCVSYFRLSGKVILFIFVIIVVGGGDGAVVITISFFVRL